MDIQNSITECKDLLTLTRAYIQGLKGKPLDENCIEQHLMKQAHAEYAQGLSERQVLIEESFWKS